MINSFPCFEKLFVTASKNDLLSRERDVVVRGKAGIVGETAPLFRLTDFSTFAGLPPHGHGVFRERCSHRTFCASAVHPSCSNETLTEYAIQMIKSIAQGVSTPQKYTHLPWRLNSCGFKSSARPDHELNASHAKRLVPVVLFRIRLLSLRGQQNDRITPEVAFGRSRYMTPCF